MPLTSQTTLWPSLPDDPGHPIQVALRTYGLSLSLSLGPSLLPFVTTLITTGRTRKSLTDFKRLLRRELGYDGFAFAITLSVGGGAAIRHLWQNLSELQMALNDNVTKTTKFPYLQRFLNKFQFALHALDCSAERKTFLSNVLSSCIGILLLQTGRERSARLNSSNTSTNKPTSPGRKASLTLDLTLLLLVRAVDSLVQGIVMHASKVLEPIVPPNQSHPQPWLVRRELAKEKQRRDNISRQTMVSRIDALVFWVSCARIMWCFFYEPQRLPPSYVKWINNLANVDSRLLQALRLIREGNWSYLTPTAPHMSILVSYAQDLGYPPSWGNPSILPAYGGAMSVPIWQDLGVKSRPGVGGLPCEVVHGHVGASLGLSDSCLANTSIRGAKAFIKAIAIYLPAHFFPVLLTRPKTLLRPHHFLRTFFGAIRSATFLSSFISLYWYSVCFTRSFGLAKLFPFISHQFWDGPYGCMMAGSLMCGSSIWIENGRRRGEMALYVLPKALRACLPSNMTKSGGRIIRITERIFFVLSISTLLTAAIHKPDSLRGLSRWTLAFVINGPNAGFWKRKRKDTSVFPTPNPSHAPSRNEDTSNPPA